MRKLLIVPVIAAIALVIACGGGNSTPDPTDTMPPMPTGATEYLVDAPKDVVLTVDMGDLSFTPSELEVSTGDVVELTITNLEETVHDFSITDIAADVFVPNSDVHDGHDDAPDVHFALNEAGDGVIYFKAFEAGTFTFFCSVLGHQQAGMEGTLTVTGEDVDHEDDADVVHDDMDMDDMDMDMDNH